MKIFTSISQSIQNFFSKESKGDGRILIVAVLLGYFGLIFFDIFEGKYPQLWRKFGVPALNYPFGDLAWVLQHFDCLRASDNNVLSQTCDFVSYPQIWLNFKILALGESETLSLGFFWIIIFYLSTFALIGKLSYRAGFFYSLVLCSPPLMLLVERCNVDIMIYFFLFLALILIKNSQKLILRFLGYLLILLMTFLKLSPFFGLAVVIKERKKYSILIGAILVGAFLIYYFSQLEDMKAIKNFFAVKGDWFSFGYTNTFYRIHAFENAPNSLNVKKRIIFTVLGLLSLFLSGKLFIDLWGNIKRWLNHDKSELSVNSLSNSEDIDAFRLGASIYIGNFLIIGKTFDYKLAFLLFAIPQILSWIKDRGAMSLSSSFAAPGILATLYLSQFNDWGIDEIINWWLLGYFIYGFCRSLPVWVTEPIHNSLKGREGS